MEQIKIPTYKINIEVEPSKEAINMSTCKLTIDAEEEISYNQIITALMCVTEQLITEQKQIRDNAEKNIQLGKSQTITDKE